MDATPMRTVKLDKYDYELVWSMDSIVQVQIEVSSNSDWTIADIASQLTSTDGNIYVDGHRLVMVNNFTSKDSFGQWWYILDVQDITPKIGGRLDEQEEQ